jgi:hypothetical protein
MGRCSVNKVRKGNSCRTNDLWVPLIALPPRTAVAAFQINDCSMREPQTSHSSFSTVSPNELVG